MKGPPGSCYGCGKMGHFHRDCLTNPYVPAFKQKLNVGGKHKLKTAEYQVDEADDKPDDTAGDNDANDAMFTVFYGARVQSPNVWIIDSGATKHMSPCRCMFF